MESVGNFLGSDAFGNISKLAKLGFDYQSMKDIQKFNNFNMDTIADANNREKNRIDSLNSVLQSHGGNLTPELPSLSTYKTV
jgi:hypothetical protein